MPPLRTLNGGERRRRSLHCRRFSPAQAAVFINLLVFADRDALARALTSQPSVSLRIRPSRFLTGSARSLSSRRAPIGSERLCPTSMHWMSWAQTASAAAVSASPASQRTEAVNSILGSIGVAMKPEAPGTSEKSPFGNTAQPTPACTASNMVARSSPSAMTCGAKRASLKRRSSFLRNTFGADGRTSGSEARSRGDTVSGLRGIAVLLTR